MLVLANPEHVYSECFRCKTVRTYADFAQTDVHCQGYCSQCRAEYRRQYAETHEGRLLNLLRTARKNAKHRGNKRSRQDDSHEYTLTQTDLDEIYREQNGLCAVTKLPLAFKSHLNTTVSLDRLDDEKGYTAENCRLVCNAINAPRKFEGAEILRFPLVQRYTVAREAAAVARARRS